MGTERTGTSRPHLGHERLARGRPCSSTQVNEFIFARTAANPSDCLKGEKVRPNSLNAGVSRTPWPTPARSATIAAPCSPVPKRPGSVTFSAMKHLAAAAEIPPGDLAYLAAFVRSLRDHVACQTCYGAFVTWTRTRPTGCWSGGRRGALRNRMQETVMLRERHATSRP
jgi:hypothetical protein